MKKFLSVIPILAMMFVPYALALFHDNDNVWLAPIMVGIVSLLSMIYPWLLTRFGYNARQILLEYASENRAYPLFRIHLPRLRDAVSINDSTYHSGNDGIAAAHP